MKNLENFHTFRNNHLLIFTLFPILVNAKNGNSHQWDGAYIFVICLFLVLGATTTAYLIRKFGCHVTRPNTPQAREIDVKVVEAIPTLSMAEVIKLNALNKVDQLECTVCLTEFKDQDVLNMLPVCLHVFHASCIEPWLASHFTCPTCRASLEHKSLSINKSDVDGVDLHNNDDYAIRVNSNEGY